MARKTTRRKATAPAAKAVAAEQTVIEEVKTAEVMTEENAPVQEQTIEEEVKETEAAEVEAVETAETTEADVEEAPKKRGRKPGTKNKQKEAETAKENKNTVYIQYANAEYNMEDIMADVQAAWVAEGHRVSSIKDLKVYIVPENGKAYYVINGKNEGEVALR